MLGLIVVGLLTSLLFLLVFYVSYSSKVSEKKKQADIDANILERQRNVKRPSDVRSANVWLRKLRK